MNEFSSLAHTCAPASTEDALPSWSDVLLRQEDLAVPYWVDQWLVNSATPASRTTQQELCEPWRRQTAWTRTGRRLATLEGLRAWLGKLIAGQAQTSSTT